MVDPLDKRDDVEDDGLACGAMAEISVSRGFQLSTSTENRFFQPVQVALPLRERWGFFLQKGRPLLLKNDAKRCQIVVRHYEPPSCVMGSAKANFAELRLMLNERSGQSLSI